jgi:hypothetical protein
LSDPWATRIAGAHKHEFQPLKLQLLADAVEA